MNIGNRQTKFKTSAGLLYTSPVQLIQLQTICSCCVSTTQLRYESGVIFLKPHLTVFHRCVFLFSSVVLDNHK